MEFHRYGIWKVSHQIKSDGWPGQSARRRWATRNTCVRCSKHRVFAGSCTSCTLWHFAFPIAAGGSFWSHRLRSYLISRPVPIHFLRVRVHVIFPRSQKFSSLLVARSVRPCRQSCVPFTTSFPQCRKGSMSRTNSYIAREFSHHPPQFREFSLPLGNSLLYAMTQSVTSVSISRGNRFVLQSLPFVALSGIIIVKVLAYHRRTSDAIVGPSPAQHPLPLHASSFRLIKVVRRIILAHGGQFRSGRIDCASVASSFRSTTVIYVNCYKSRLSFLVGRITSVESVNS